MKESLFLDLSAQTVGDGGGGLGVGVPDGSLSLIGGMLKSQGN